MMMEALPNTNVGCVFVISSTAGGFSPTKWYGPQVEIAINNISILSPLFSLFFFCCFCCRHQMSEEQTSEDVVDALLSHVCGSPFVRWTIVNDRPPGAGSRRALWHND